MCISLRPPIYVMGSNVNMGSFGVTGVKVIYIKKAITLPCYIAWSYMVTLTYPLASDPLSHLQDQQANWGQSGVEVSKPAGYAVCDGNVSSFLFLLSFWQHVFFTYFPTFDFDQTWSQWPVCWPLLRHKHWWGQRSGWGHWGQKGHFHQKGIKSFKILSIDAWLMHMHKLDLLYKSYGPKNSSGVIWGHRGQKVIFTKKASSPSEYVAFSWLTHMH